METLIRKNQAGIISTYIYDEDTGAKMLGVSLSSVTSIVYDPYGNELTASAIVTPETDGELKAVISNSITGSVLVECRVRFTYTYNSLEHVKDVAFTIGDTKFDPPAQYEDLVRCVPSLVNKSRSEDSRYQDTRRAAVDELYLRLKNSGLMPHFIVNQYVLKDCLLYLWLSKIFMSLSTTSPVFKDYADSYFSRYQEFYASVNINQGTGEDADTDQDEPVPIARWKLKRA